MTGHRPSDLPRLLIDDAACINVRGRTPVCAACKDACAAQALTLSLDRVELDSGRCTACGACAAKCPAGAIALPAFSPPAFVRSLSGRPAVHIHCSAGADGAAGRDDAFVIACHKVLDARVLAAAAAAGTTCFELHGLGQCGPCPKGSAVAPVASIQATLQAWFAQDAPQVRVVADGRDEAQAQRWQEDRVTRSRRGFLSGAGLRASAGGAALQRAHAGAPEHATAPPPVDLEHRRAASYQAVLREHAAALPWRHLPWRQRSIGPACTACMACAQRCPTGALVGVHESGARRIDYELGLCTGCRLCEQICPEQAITSQPATSVDEVVAGPVTLMSRPRCVCASCRRPYVADGGAAELCPACRKERALKHDWLGQLGVGGARRDLGAV